jgi:hypothetical protein
MYRSFLLFGGNTLMSPSLFTALVVVIMFKCLNLGANDAIPTEDRLVS